MFLKSHNIHCIMKSKLKIIQRNEEKHTIKHSSNSLKITQPTYLHISFDMVYRCLEISSSNLHFHVQWTNWILNMIVLQQA